MTKITILSLIAGVAGTGIGGLFGIVFSDKGKKFVSCVLNFAAGIMLAMVFLNLIPTALTQSDTPQIKLIVLVGVVLGGAGIYLLNLAINGVNLRVHAVSTDNTAKNFLKSGIILFLAISLHNIPEGLALGCFGVNDNENVIVFTALLALHNLPEGMAISLPLRKGGTGRTKSVLLSVLGGAMTVLGAVLGFLIGNVAPVTNSFFLAIAAGAMLVVTFVEVIPQAFDGSEDFSFLFVPIGAIVGAALIFLV